MIRLPGELPLDLGRIVATPGALAAMEEADATALPFLVRHASGDWGDAPEEDAALNEEAVRDFLRVMSVYRLHTGETLWIITEADRSSTTILLPSEY